MPDPINTASLAELIERFGAQLDRQDAALMRVTVQALTGAGPFALSAADHGGKRLRIGNGAATATIVVTLPADAPVGTVFLPRQAGYGALKFVPASDAMLINRAGHNGTSGEAAAVSLTCEVAGIWYLDGNTAAVA